MVRLSTKQLQNIQNESGKELQQQLKRKQKLSIYYEVHREDYGWEVDAKDEADLSKWKSDGMDSGTVGECKRLEAIKIKLPDGVSGSVQYRTHIQDIGWEANGQKMELFREQAERQNVWKQSK